MIKVSYLEQQDGTLEFYTEWEWHCVKVVPDCISDLAESIAIHGATMPTAQCQWSLNKGFAAGCR